MCGRINVSDHQGVQELLNWLNIPLHPNQFESRFNIAPSAILNTIFASPTPSLVPMEWGIIPPWAKPNQFNRPLANARAETIWEKPSFKSLIKTNRTIIPVNGFYEWQRTNSTKKPFYIHASESNALALGAIYQITPDKKYQCCVVTTAANQTMSTVHDRMPVILSPEVMKDWLFSNDTEHLNQLMLPCADNKVTITPVSPYVNNARNEGPQCLAPAEKQKDLFS